MASPPSTSSSSFFPSFSAYLGAVRDAAEGPVDRRLTKIAAAATTVSQESAGGADGGYIVPPDFAGFVRSVVAEDSLFGLCLQRQTTSYSVNAWTDAQPPWSSSGIKPKRQGEAAAVQQAKPVVAARSAPLHKLQVMIPCTEEVLEDAIGADVYFQSAFRDRSAFAINDWFLNGTGVGQPLGVLNSPAAIVVSKETSQTADTINTTNLGKMMARLYAPSRSRAIWCVSPGAMGNIEGTLGGPAGVLDYNGDGGRARLLGRPVFITDAAAAVGDQGDIVLVDPQAVLALSRPGGPQFAISTGVYFDVGTQAFRAVLRLGLLPLWSAAVQPAHGSSTVSTIVTLEPR